MSDAEELAALRRLAELENKANSVMSPQRMSASGMDTGPVDAALIAAGRTSDKVIQGVKQLGLGGISRFGPPSFATAANADLAALQNAEAEKDAAYGALKEKRPFATAIGEGAPYVAIPASAGIPTMMAGSALLGGLQYGTPEQRMGRAATDAGAALIGGLAGNAVGSAVAPGRAAMNESKSLALDAAGRIGYKPRLSEITGSPLAARIEDVSARIPGGAGVMQRLEQSNASALNRAAASSIGENATELTPRVFGAAADRLGKVFEDIKSLSTVKVNGRDVLPIQINKSVGTVADDVLRKQGKMIASQQDAQLVELAKQAKALAANNGRIDGETYQLIRSGLSEAAFDATGTNKTLYGSLLSALDSSAEQSLRQSGNGALADALKAARPQYANLKILEKGATAQGGDVSAAKVASTMRTNNPSAFREGRTSGPLTDVALVGEGMSRLKAGSPTFERSVMDPLSLLLYSPLSYLGAKATTNPLINNYAAFAARSPTMGILSQFANPAVRGPAMGLLGSSPNILLAPEMAKN